MIIKENSINLIKWMEFVQRKKHSSCERNTVYVTVSTLMVLYPYYFRFVFILLIILYFTYGKSGRRSGLLVLPLMSFVEKLPMDTSTHRLSVLTRIIEMTCRYRITTSLPVDCVRPGEFMTVKVINFKT